MLWKHYVHCRADGVHDMWDRLFENRPIRLLYIAGRGFDTRAQAVMREFMDNLKSRKRQVERSELVLVSLSGYELTDDLHQLTTANEAALLNLFSPSEPLKSVVIGSSAGGEDDIGGSNALRVSTANILKYVGDQTDIVLDVSSLPRLVYLAIMTALLDRLIPNKLLPNPLAANGINFQVLVAEDAELDAAIRAEDPSNELVTIPGFSSILHVESVQEWPMVWFPILGENRVSQLQKVLTLASIPGHAEICPVLPHPSRDPRRADRLLIEYRAPLFDERETPTANLLFVHENQPFEAYRQILKAMERYKDSLGIIGGCRLVMTPLASKLITLGAGLACFEMKSADIAATYGVAIAAVQPTRYTAVRQSFENANPVISSMVLTGSAYSE